MRIGIAALISLIVVLNGCSKASKENASDAGQPGQDAAVTPPVEVVVGPSGGRVDLGNKVALEIPEGALTRETTIRIAELSSVDATSLGVRRVLGNIISLGPEDVELTKPVVVRFTLDPSQTEVPSPRAGAGVVLLRRPTGSTDMNAFLPVSSASIGASEVVAQTTHFSEWLPVLLEGIGCASTVGTCADDGCDPATAGPNGCSAACTYRSADQLKSLQCLINERGLTPVFACTCTGGGPQQRFTLSDVSLGGPVAAFLASRCGLGCEGVDAGPVDAAATPDASEPPASRISCARYDAAGDPNQFPPRNTFVRTLAVFNGRIYWSTDEMYASRIHSRALDLTDHQSIPNQVGVRALGTNGTHLFWVNGAPANPGLYELTPANLTPRRLAAAQPSPYYVFANATHVFYATILLGASTVYRAGLDGSGEQVVFASGEGLVRLGDDGYLYTGTSGGTAAVEFGCPMNDAPFILRRRSDMMNATPEIILDGCALLPLTGRTNVVLSRFTVDATHVYLSTNHGDIIAAPRGGGGPVRLMHLGGASNRGLGAEIVRVGEDIVWIDEVGGISRLPKTAESGVDNPVRLVPEFRAFRELVADGAYVYLASYEEICRVLVTD